MESRTNLISQTTLVHLVRISQVPPPYDRLKSLLQKSHLKGGAGGGGEGGRDKTIILNNL